MANVNFHGYSSGGSGGAVDSVNGKSGAVVLYGTDIAMSSSDSETIASEIGDINTTLSGLATVATTGDYDDLIDKPSLATVATTGDYDDLIDKPSLATVATSGSYADLTNKPTIPDDLNDLNDVVLSSPQNAQVLKYDSSTSKWVNANESGGGGGATIDDTTISTLSCWSSSKTNTEITTRHKVTNVAVDLTGWTQDSTSQSGSTFYKKQITLNHIYVDSPTVEIGAYNAVLPTTAQQTTYDYLRYVTVDDTVPCIYLYADENMMSDSDRTSFYIDIEGCD